MDRVSEHNSLSCIYTNNRQWFMRIDTSVIIKFELI